MFDAASPSTGSHYTFTAYLWRMWNSHCSANSACRQRLFLATGNTCCAVSLVYIIHNENARKPTELLAPPLLTDAACAVFNRAALTFQQIALFFFVFFFSQQPSRSSKKVHNFGKRSNSIKRNLNAPVMKSGWLHKQVPELGFWLRSVT